MKSILFLFVSFYTFQVFAQDSLSKPVITAEMKKEFKKNQHRLDLNHGGIGISLFKPNLSTIATYDRPWIGVDILSDILQFKFGLGTNQLMVRFHMVLLAQNTSTPVNLAINFQLELMPQSNS